jgi:hypothetical protein
MLRFTGASSFSARLATRARNIRIKFSQFRPRVRAFRSRCPLHRKRESRCRLSHTVRTNHGAADFAPDCSSLCGGANLSVMLYRKPALAMLLALIFLSFFGTLGVSAAMFPDNYDWRYRVISNLLSPRDNPQHYLLSACATTRRIFTAAFRNNLATRRTREQRR